jgi:Flp pilus assembly protein TadG
VGVFFVFSKAAERKSLEKFLRSVVKSANGNAISQKDTEGQALVEFALIVPLLFLLIVNMVNFGGFFYAWITVANAARVGAQYAVLGGASVGSPAQPTTAAVDTVINNDVFSLLNGSSPTVKICIYNGATIEATPYQQGTCTGTSPDPESSLYASAVVDVTYTYNPLIPLFSFPGLGIHATLPPTTIHRRAYMRVIQ